MDDNLVRVCLRTCALAFNRLKKSWVFLLILYFIIFLSPCNKIFKDKSVCFMAAIASHVSCSVNHENVFFFTNIEVKCLGNYKSDKAWLIFFCSTYCKQLILDLIAKFCILLLNFQVSSSNFMVFITFCMRLDVGIYRVSLYVKAAGPSLIIF